VLSSLPSGPCWVSSPCLGKDGGSVPGYCQVQKLRNSESNSQEQAEYSPSSANEVLGRLFRAWKYLFSSHAELCWAQKRTSPRNLHHHAVSQILPHKNQARKGCPPKPSCPTMDSAEVCKPTDLANCRTGNTIKFFPAMM
jgi:hypothetical protein